MNKANTGLVKATAAAKSINGLLAVPTKIKGRKGTDFNDIHLSHGLEAVKASIDGAKHPDAKEVQKLCVFDLQKFLELEIEGRKYILYPIIPVQGLDMLYAERGIGKTHVALGISYAVATGGAFLSWKAECPYPVLYIDGEMPANTMQERLAAIICSSELTPQEGFFNVLTPDLQGDAMMPNLATKEGQEAIEPHLKGIKLVVIDNLATLCRNGRSNDEESWIPVQEWILSLRRRGISVLLVHHSSKNGSQRGTSAKEDILDTVIQLRRPKDYSPEQGARFEVHLTKARGIIGEDAEPFEAQLTTHNGIASWTVKSIEDAQAEQVRNLAAENATQREIAEELGISTAKVNRLCRKHNIQTKGGRK